VTTFWCEHAELGAGAVPGVRISVDDGRITAVDRAPTPAPGDTRLTGVVLPGFANAHSHAFHRALRGRTHDSGGTFWTWRDRMYAVAARLDPGSYLALARATYAEMALAGITCVGEFHYLHHPPGGGRYRDPNAMSAALVQAAADAGIRLTLLDACYVAGGLEADGHLPLTDVQARFSDGDAHAWAARVGELAERPGLRIGAAVHSVRAVPRDQLPAVVAAASGRPLHVHLSEQPAENAACHGFYGCTPTSLLADAGALGPDSTVVHATHLTDDDVRAVGGSGTGVCACPSTEADLADGIGAFRRLRDAGSPLCLGTDQQALTDLLGEARLLEADQRLVSGERGRFRPAELVEALTVAGHRALGWPDAGRLAPGQRADLVAVRLDSVRTAGSTPGQVLMAASAADVHTVVVDGRVVVSEGRHVLGDVARLLADAIEPLWEVP
jgi:formiminoglutamate deiminase